MNPFTAPFGNIRKGTSFMFNGSYYRKETTRTARLVEIYSRVFYFRQRDLVTIHNPKDLIQQG